MIYLICAVLCSVSVSVLLKILRQRGLDIRQTIVLGYPVAFLLTGVLLKPDLSTVSTLTTPAWAIILALGVLLPAVFVILGRALATAGIIATDAAQRLSLIIPIIAAFVLFGETLTTHRLVGIGLGFLALFALMYPANGSVSSPQKPAQDNIASGSSTNDLPEPSSTHGVSEIVQSRRSTTERIPNSKSEISRKTSENVHASTLSKVDKDRLFFGNGISLLGVWLGYGVIDILFKQVAKQGSAFPVTLFISFGLAGVFLLGYLLIKQLTDQSVRWQASALRYGVLLGVLNMGNIYAYVRAHQTLHESPSIVFTGMNVGVIAVASIVGVAVFRERLSPVNVLGLILAMSCVVVLFLK